MTTKEKIIKTISEIPEEKLTELLSMVEDFKKQSGAASGGNKWDRFLGILSDEEAEAILAVIEEECERIDHD
jgi:hypothetical protein